MNAIKIKVSKPVECSACGDEVLPHHEAWAVPINKSGWVEYSIVHGTKYDPECLPAVSAGDTDSVAGA